jgi:hypothetical protein
MSELLDLPPGPQGGYGTGPATLCRGYPLGHTDPSPAFALHRYRRTALHWAVLFGHLPTARALIHAGAPLGICDNGRLALCAAGRRGAELAAGRRVPVPPPMPPSPAGRRPCTALPNTATPTQRPRCSAPARTRPSRTATGNAVPRRTGRPPPAAMPPVSCRRTAEERAQRYGKSDAYAAAVAQAHTFGPSFGTFSRRHRAPRPHYRPRVHLQSTRARPAAAVGTFIRVCCCAAPARKTRADQHVSWSRARYLTMHGECAFPPTQRELTRGVAGPTSHGGDEGGAFRRLARQGERREIDIRL